MRKLISSFIAVFLMVAIISSCSADAPDLMDFLGDSTESVYADFRGRDVIFGVPEITQDSLIPLMEETSTKADAQRVIIKNVETKLNCTIKQEIVDLSKVAASIISDICKFDLIYTHTGAQIDLVKGGYFYDISKMEGIDLSNEKKWGTPQDQQHRTYQGMVFGVKPQTAGSSYSSLEGVMMVNDSLVKSFGQPTPKELLENGEWTFDRFLDYVVSVSDMQSDSPTYGMTYYTGQLCQIPLTAIFANGSSILAENGSGYKFNLMNDPKATVALEWAKDVVDTGVIADDDFDTTPAGYFTNGMSSLWLGGAWVGTDNKDGFPLIELDEGFSFMCMPYGPDAEYGKTYSSFIFVSRSLAVPISSDEYEMSCFLNEFCVELSDEELEALKTETMEFYFHSAEDYELLIDMADNAVYTYLYAELDDVRDNIIGALENICSGSVTIAEGLGSIEGKISAEIEKIN